MKISKTLISTIIFVMLLSTFSINVFSSSEITNDYINEVDSDFFMGLDREGNIINMYTEDLETEIGMGAPMTLNADEDDFVVYDRTKDIVLQTFDNEKDANEYLKESDTNQDIVVFQGAETHNLNYGVVNFNLKGIRTNTNFVEEGTNFSRYTNGQYGADAVFLGYAPDGRVRFKLAGVIGLVNKNDVQIVDYKDTKRVSKYFTLNDRVYHGIVNDINASRDASQQDIGPRPSYLENNKVYYSYDGHYFYETFNKMVDDYKKGNYANSVNAKNPFYNYYQFLSHRSVSNITAEQIDKYFKDKAQTTSKLQGLGKALKEAESKYGVNALLIAGVAINESGWGTSYYSQNRNNLFGHGANDSNPDNATKYKTAGDSIIAHASDYISDGYLDPCDWSTANNGFTDACKGGRYNGGHLGDKRAGSNVMYASDPYWGEKAAAQVHVIEKNGYTKEKREKVGVVLDKTVLNVRKEANTTSTLLYRTKPGDSITFKILDAVKGEVYDGTDIWYKIQSDPVLDKTRSKLLQNNRPTRINEYDMANMYGYVHASFVHIADEDIAPPGSKNKPGDLNGDGSIGVGDVAKIQAYLVGTYKLTPNELIIANVNKKGGVTLADLAMVQAHYMGTYKIEGW